MSELARMCQRLDGIAGDISQMASELASIASALNRASARVAQTLGSSNGSRAEGQRAAQALSAGARACASASSQLAHADRTARAYVASEYSGTGGSGVTPRPAASDGASGTLTGGLDAGSVQAVLQSATATQAGLAFFSADDATLAAAKALPEMPGYRTYDLHGNPESVAVWAGGQEVSIGPSAFADVVRGDPGWQGSPVRLFSCDTGKGSESFAQLLADELGVEVYAPTELAWSDSTGQSWSATSYLDDWGIPRPTDPPDGEFVSFLPRGSAV